MPYLPYPLSRTDRQKPLKANILLKDVVQNVQTATLKSNHIVLQSVTRRGSCHERGDHAMSTFPDTPHRSYRGSRHTARAYIAAYDHNINQLVFHVALAWSRRRPPRTLSGGACNVRSPTTLTYRAVSDCRLCLFGCSEASRILAPVGTRHSTCIGRVVIAWGKRSHHPCVVLAGDCCCRCAGITLLVLSTCYCMCDWYYRLKKTMHWHPA